MRRLAGRALLVGVGLLNIVPAAGAVVPEGMYAAYGIAPAGRDLEVVLRHRALLFAVIGIGLLVAVFRPGWRPFALSANAISLGGFLVLAFAGGSVGPGLVRVAAVDVVGLVALGAGAALLRADEPQPLVAGQR
ncbi:hypothetical protein [Nocardia sp. NPDC051832]|uniref:hypothetical protein n=1 Tax=Nocardia sp. NPDC051832 TaxID=3155673 RepID=UPI003445FC8A